MHDPLPSCFHTTTTTKSPSTLTTSIYETHLGIASLSWSRTFFGLSLSFDLHQTDNNSSPEQQQQPLLHFTIRPSLLWKRRGSRKLQLNSHSLHITWDLTHAKFPSSSSPEPSSNYHLTVSINDQLLLLAGDNNNGLIRSALISKREHVLMGKDMCYKTRLSFGGAKDKQIEIKVNGEMSVQIDGQRVLNIRRLKWKFRGSEKVEVEGGAKIQVSWDLHNWLFQEEKNEESDGGNDHSRRAAVFVFRFEGSGEGHCGKEWGYFGKSIELNSSSESGSEKKQRKSKKSLLKTSSSSSSSSASSAGSSTVMEWASREEDELRSKEGFSLMVYAWKS